MNSGLPIFVAPEFFEIQVLSAKNSALDKYKNELTTIQNNSNSTQTRNIINSKLKILNLRQTTWKTKKATLNLSGIIVNTATCEDLHLPPGTTVVNSPALIAQTLGHSWAPTFGGKFLDLSKAHRFLRNYSASVNWTWDTIGPIGPGTHLGPLAQLGT